MHFIGSVSDWTLSLHVIYDEEINGIKYNFHIYTNGTPVLYEEWTLGKISPRIG